MTDPTYITHRRDETLDAKREDLGFTGSKASKANPKCPTGKSELAKCVSALVKAAVVKVGPDRGLPQAQLDGDIVVRGQGA